LDGDCHERLAPGERRILITLAAQQTITEHQKRMTAVEARACRQMLRKLLGLLRIQPQEQRHRDSPQTNATLNATVVDAVSEADSVDDLGMFLHVLQCGERRDVKLRVTLARKDSPVTSDEHQSAGCRGERVLGWIAMNM